MITCSGCSSSNADSRRYCRECGDIIVQDCIKCGFSNSRGDRYCGGCGLNLTGQPEQQPRTSQTSPKSATYSYNDLSDLIQEKTPKSTQQKKEMKGTDSVSQDMLDSIFEESDD